MYPGRDFPTKSLHADGIDSRETYGLEGHFFPRVERHLLAVQLLFYLKLGPSTAFRSPIYHKPERFSFQRGRKTGQEFDLGVTSGDQYAASRDLKP